MSKRLTDKERAEVVTDYASGKTKSDIARKFNVSPNAISKILEKFKSSMNELKVQGEVQESSKDNREVARVIYNKALQGLTEKVNKASAGELLKILEYFDLRYNFGDDGSDERISEIKITIEDASKNETRD